MEKRKDMEKDPIRVLHVFGAMNPGGVETLVMNVYRRIDRDKVQFDFALTQGVRSLLDDEAKTLGGRLFYFDQKKPLMKNLSEILEKYGPFQAVHSHVYFYSGAILLNAKRHSVPVRIAHAHNTSFGQVYTWKRKGYEWLMRKMILRCATVMLGCSRDACEFVFGPECMQDPRCSILCNGFDVEAFLFSNNNRERIRRQYGLEEKMVVGHVGRFEEQKNHLQLVEQFAAIHRVRADAALLLVGRGSLMDIVRDKCACLGIQDAVIFAGAQKHPAPFLSAMDAFLFPSLYEGLGSAIMEAQANGLHVVTSAGVVPQEVDITGNTSFVALSESPEKWAEEILFHSGRKDPEKANRLVREKYDIRIITETLTMIYCKDSY